VRKLLIGGLVTLTTLCAVPAMAGSVDLTMTGIGLSNNLGGVYIGPYTVETTGTTNTFQVICDDFLADTNIGEAWTAVTSGLSPLTGKFAADGAAAYDEVGFLATTLFNFSSATVCPIGSCAGVNNSADIQYALWQVFDGTGANTAFSHLTGADLTNAQDWLNLAALPANIAAGAADFANLVIYTPTSCSVNCSGLPQEFIGRVPEPGTFALLGIGMLGVVFYGRRKFVRRDVTT
jgi:hypothetical protein